MSQDHDQVVEDRPSFWRRGWKWKLPLLAVVALAGLFGWYRWDLSRQVDAKLAEIRAAGYPVTLEELNAWYETPPLEENAAHVYQRAFNLFAHDPVLEKRVPMFSLEVNLPPTGVVLSGDVLADIDEYLRINQAALATLDEATAMPKCRLPLDYQSSALVDLGYVSGLRRCGRLSALQAVAQAEHGQAGGCAESIRRIFIIARLLEYPPCLLSYTVAIAIRATGHSMLERVLARISLDDSQLRMLAETVATEPTGLDRAFIGERCLFIDGLSKLLNHDDVMPDIRKAAESENIRLNRLVDRELLRYFDWYDRLKAIVDLPVDEQWQALLSMGISDDSTGVLDVADRSTRGHVAMVKQILQACAGSRTASAVIAIKRFELSEHQLPTGLNELVPKYLDQVPSDPFNHGKPLKYKQADDWFVVYSVGTDGVDNGGLRETEELQEYQNGTDIVFEGVRTER